MGEGEVWVRMKVRAWVRVRLTEHGVELLWCGWG